MADFHQDCVFCREIAGRGDTNFARLYPELASTGRMIAETENFVAFPCIGQLHPGHTLIIPRSHIKTMREASCGAEGQMKEFGEILRSVHEYFNTASGDALYFEHGVHSSDGGGCGIYHAHLHVIPSAGNVILADFGFTSETKTAITLEAALRTPAVLSDYVLMGSLASGFRIAALSAPLPSQTLRRHVASALGLGDKWNWRTAGREQTMLDALEMQS